MQPEKSFLLVSRVGQPVGHERIISKQITCQIGHVVIWHRRWLFHLIISFSEGKIQKVKAVNAHFTAQQKEATLGEIFQGGREPSKCSRNS